MLDNIINEIFKNDSENLIKKLLLEMKNAVYFKYLIKKKKINIWVNILKSLKLVQYKPNQIVYHEGVESNNCFFIWKGGVNIYWKNKNYLKNQDKYDPEFYKNFNNDEKIFDKNGYFQLYKVESFNTDGLLVGEKGLMNFEKRSATIITNNISKTTYLAYITKSEFKEYILDIEKQKLKKKLDFFKIIFKKCFTKEYDIFKISNLFKKIKIKKNDYLFKKDEKFNKIFIINKGNLLLENKVKINFFNFYKNIESIDNVDYIKYKKMIFKKKLNHPLNDIINTYDVRVYKKYDFHGLNEFINKSKYNIFSGKNSSDTLSVYYITIKNFVRIYKEYINLRLLIRNLNMYLNFSNIYKNERLLIHNLKEYYQLNTINNFFIKVYLSNQYTEKIDNINEIIENKNFSKMRSVILIYLKKSYEIYKKIKLKNKFNHNFSEDKKENIEECKKNNIINGNVKYKLKERKNIFLNYTFLNLDFKKKLEIKNKKLKIKKNNSLFIKEKYLDTTFKVKYIKNNRNSNKIIRISKNKEKLTYYDFIKKNKSIFYKNKKHLINKTSLDIK